MFQWDFDKPCAPVNFETTLSQDLLEFNNFFNQNVSAQISPIPAQAMPPMNFSGNALSNFQEQEEQPIIDYMTYNACLLYTSPSPRDRQKSRMPSSA